MSSFVRSSLSLALVVLLLLVPLGESSAVDATTDAPIAVSQAGDASAPVGDATATDHGLIAALVAVVIITGLTALGTSLNIKFTTVSTTVNSVGGGTPAPPVGGIEEFSAQHVPGGSTSSDASVSADFADGGHAHSTTTASSDFSNLVFHFTEQAAVLNAATATDAPNVKLEHELLWTLTLLADEPQGGAPPGATAVLRMDFGFEQLAWGIGGPVPHQDGIFEIEGPDGSVWGWSMEKNVTSGQLELTSTYGPLPGSFSFDGSGAPVIIENVEFQSAEVMTGVSPGPSFTFEIPYGVPTDVSFTIRRLSHTMVPDISTVPGLDWVGRLALLLGMAGVGVWRVRRAGFGVRRSPS